ncbi:M48 family metalloprotease [Patescibacteria group bacterium]|nr:M48 family metalloprotease [Patescibacteria group bacterium]
MLPQSAIVLTAGLIFLFFWTPNPLNIHITQIHSIILLTLFLTVIPAVITLIISRLSLRRYKYSSINPYAATFLGLISSILSIGCFIIQIYWIQIPFYLMQSLFPRFVNTKTFLVIILLVISFFLCRLVLFWFKKQTTDPTLTAKHYFLPDLKLMFIPSIPFLFNLLISDIIDIMPLSVRIFFITNHYIYWLIIIGIAIFMFIKSPYFIRHIWSAQSLAKGEIRDRIISLASRENIRFGDILVWNMGGRSVANAGMAGLLPKSRTIFVTDFLLSNYTLDEIETVIAHEFGHIKLGHIPAYIIFSFAYLSIAGVLYGLFLPVLNRLSSSDTITALLGGIFTVLLFLIYFVIIFRFISRKFERQADIYAVKITEKPDAFKSALMKIAYVNQIMIKNPRIINIFSTHPSIHERLGLIDNAIVDEHTATKYNKTFFSAKRSFLFLITALVALWFMGKDFILPPSELHYEIGRQYAIEGMIDNAISEFDSAVNLNPKSDDAVYALGLLYNEKGAVDEAKKQFHKALAINPKNKMALNRLEQLQKAKSR